jgi:hypothetical protein
VVVRSLATYHGADADDLGIRYTHVIATKFLVHSATARHADAAVVRRSTIERRKITIKSALAIAIVRRPSGQTP